MTYHETSVRSSTTTTRPTVAEQHGGGTPSRREFEELEQYAETIRDDMITMREEAELLRSLSTWNYDMSTAPKDRLILGLCRHDADPYHDEATERLTDYGCSAEGMGRVQDGPHVLIWGGGDSDYDEWAQKTISWPDWWFRFGSEFEEAANPIAWMAIPDMP